MRIDAIYAFLCFMIPGILCLVIRSIKYKNSDNRVRHIIWCVIYIYYGYLTVEDAAGIGTIWDLISYGEIKGGINLIPFAKCGIVTNMLNILMFMPLGFLLPLIWKNFDKAYKAMLFGFCMSLAIELAQLMCLRTTDINDLIMNTLGTLIGYLCWKLFSLLFKRVGEHYTAFGRGEAALYMAAGTLGIILLYNWRWT